MHFVTIQVCGQLPTLSSCCIMLDKFPSMKTNIAQTLDALYQLLHILAPGCNQPLCKLSHSLSICAMPYNYAATVEKATMH